MKLLSFKKREPQPAAPVLSEELAPDAVSSETACSPAAVAAPAEAVPGEGERVLSAGEAAQYREFLRRKREEELSFMLRRLIALEAPALAEPMPEQLSLFDSVV